MTETVSPPDRMLTIGKTASKLGCCKATVYREIARKRLPAQKVGNQWRIAPEDLRAYLTRSDDYTELIKEIVESAPPPTPELLRRLAVLFDYALPAVSRD